MRIVIIEDEKIIARDLIVTLKSVNETIDVIKTLYSVNQAIQYFREPHDIDLIFSDIQLGDGLSFEIFQKVSLDTPIIFCTAYNEYALEAFNTNSIDYIVKPFSETSIRDALSKYEKLKKKFEKNSIASLSSSEIYASIMKLLETPSYSHPQSIIVKKRGDFIPIQFENIALFYIEDKYVFAYTFDQTRYLVSQKMEYLESICGNAFYRANRQYLVNRTAIKNASQYFNRKLLLNLTIEFKEKITVGKLKVTHFLNWLEG